MLAKWTFSLDSSCCSRDQNHSQYAPLKITCIKEVTCFFSKIKSLRVHQIAQIRAVALTKINNLSFLFTPVNQYPSIWDIDLGGVNPVAMWTIRQIILACWQSKNMCLIVSLHHRSNIFNSQSNSFLLNYPWLKYHLAGGTKWKFWFLAESWASK